MQESTTNTIDGASCDNPPLRGEALGAALHSILSPIPLYPRPLRHPDHDDDPRDHSPNPPADNAITFMQLSNFQKCASPPPPSPPPVPLQPASSEGEGGRGRGGRKEQNLKNISQHILSLIGQNPQLTIPQLCNLLYEMIGRTQLGADIISSGYALPSPDLLEQLKLKYQEGEPQDERLRMVVKNVRRRLYDSLNVMISAKVLRKVAKNRLEVVDGSRGAGEGGAEEGEDEVVRRLKEQLELRKAEVSSKTSVREFLRQKTQLVKRLVDRNTPHFFEVDKSSLFYLPIVLADFPQDMMVSLSATRLTIES